MLRRRPPFAFPTPCANPPSNRLLPGNNARTLYERMKRELAREAVPPRQEIRHGGVTGRPMKSMTIPVFIVS